MFIFLCLHCCRLWERGIVFTQKGAVDESLPWMTYCLSDIVMYIYMYSNYMYFLCTYIRQKPGE